jgi:hypothetical protein
MRQEKMDDFAIFILTYNRPENQITLDFFKKINYDGKIVLVISDDDPKIEKYKELYSNTENIILYIFSKDDASKLVDTFDNDENKRGVVYARNYSWTIAKNLNLSSFLMLDDDYFYFALRKGFSDKPMSVAHRLTLTEFNQINKMFVDYLKNTNIQTLCFSQAGDWMGGANNTSIHRPKRKVMNSFYCLTDRPFRFQGRINEDVNLYVQQSHVGKIFLTITGVMLCQKLTQHQTGGLTELYLNASTYTKSFYTVMCHPSGTKIYFMGKTNKRLHHKINGDRTYPKILHEKYKK